MTELEDDARPAGIQGLVFDLGGVVIDLDFGRVFARWGELADADPVELRARWAMDDAYERYPLYGFTNSNATHTACWERRYGDLLSPFETVFVSSTIGLRKPEARAFHFIADTVGLPIGALHFFDDSEENVLGARAAGMSASHVTSFAELEAATNALGRAF